MHLKFTRIGLGAETPCLPCYTFRRNVWERGPPSDQRDDGGGRIPSWAQSSPPAYADRKHYPKSLRNQKRVSATLILSARGCLSLRTESPSQGYRLTAASLPAPDVPSERMGEGTAVGPTGRRWWKDSHGSRNPPTCTYRSEARPQSAQKPRAAQELSRTQKGAFFFTKKASCVNQTFCVAESRKSVQTQPPLFPPLKKPLKITGSKGI